MIRDHISIACGINALVADAVLTKRGCKVLTLKRVKRGGCVSFAFGATRPGLARDVMAAKFGRVPSSPAHAVPEACPAQHMTDLAKIKRAHSPSASAGLAPMIITLTGGAPHVDSLGIDRTFLSRPFAYFTKGTNALRKISTIFASSSLDPGHGPSHGGKSGYLAAKRLRA